MCRESLRREPFRRRFRCDSLRTVLAKLGNLSIIIRIRPRAARTIETVLLIDLEQRLKTSLHTHLSDADTGRVKDGTQARRGVGGRRAAGPAIFRRRLRAR